MKARIDYKWRLLSLLSATYFLAQGTRQIYNAVLPQIKSDFAASGLDDLQLGLVGSAFTLVFGLVIPFAGTCADFLRRKWIVVFGTLLFSVGIFTSGLASGLGLLIVSYGVLNAAGQSMLPPSISSLIGQFHVGTRATAFSIYQMVFYVGIVVCSAVSGWLSGVWARAAGAGRSDSSARSASFGRLRSRSSCGTRHSRSRQRKRTSRPCARPCARSSGTRRRFC